MRNRSEAELGEAKRANEDFHHFSPHNPKTFIKKYYFCGYNHINLLS